MKNFAILASILALASCAAPGAAPNDKNGAPLGPVSPASLEVEQAVRDLDVGHDAAAARKKLEGALLDPTLPEPTRDLATLALARALDKTGDKEKAIRTVEALLVKHEGEHPWSFEEQADELLQVLVTGSVQRLPRDDSGRAIAPIARALSTFFPAKDGKTRIRQFLIGTSGASERLGTYAIGEALRAQKQEACPLCDDKISAHTSSSQSNWSSIPAGRAKYDDALVVFYFDLETQTIPARYDDVLPMPSADVLARLQKGEGLVTVKMRDNAPPVILIAAPRSAQLADVEEAFAQMTQLPTSPVSVGVSSRLRNSEIKGVFRGARPAFRACAEALMTRAPKAAGTITFKLKVLGDGTVTGLTSQAEAALDETFIGCMEKATRALTFPRAGVETSVTYPLLVTPD